MIDSDAIIDPGTNALIERIEAGGLNFYIMDCSLGPVLAFEYGRPPFTLDATQASIELAQRFKADAGVRERMTEYALSVGAYYRGV